MLNDPRRVSNQKLDLEEYVTCGPIIQEVFQGLDVRNRLAPEFRTIFLELPRLSDPLPLELFLNAADIYREGRRRGFTIRSTIDCLIAAIALEHHVALWHRDRDFTTIARYTPLKAVSRYLT